MAKDIKIAFREANEADFEYVKGLQESLMRELVEEYSPWDSDRAIGDLRKAFNEESAQIILVNGKDAGFLHTRIKDDILVIDRIYIDSNYQGKGVGTSVIKDLVISHCVDKHKKISLGVLKNNRAFELYKRLGFKVTAEDKRRYLMEYRV